jgi:triacylglycerol lipase
MNYEWDWAGAERLCKQAIALAAIYNVLMGTLSTAARHDR